MKLRKLVLGLVVAATAGAPGLAQAACTLSDVAGKTWKVSAAELSRSPENVLFFCKFSVASSGSIAAAANACEDSRIGTSSNFASPSKYNITSGSSVTLVSGAECTFDATLKLVNGQTVFRGRFVLESGKTMGAGNFLVNWGGGGTFSIMKM